MIIILIIIIIILIMIMIIYYILGGCGVVFKGKWLKLDVAIKQFTLVQLSPSVREEFKVETLMMRSVCFGCVMCYV